MNLELETGPSRPINKSSAGTEANERSAMRNFVFAAAMAAMVFGCQQMQGPPGDKGAPGQKGDKGDKGDLGPVGPHGPQGDSVLADMFGEECKADDDCAVTNYLTCDKQAKVCRLQTAAEYRKELRDAERKRVKEILEAALKTLVAAKKECSEDKAMCGESLAFAHTSVKEAEERARKAGAEVAAPKAKPADPSKKSDDKSGSKGDEPLAGKLTTLEGRVDAIEGASEATTKATAAARDAATTAVTVAKGAVDEAKKAVLAGAAPATEKSEAAEVAIDEVRFKTCVAGLGRNPFFAEDVPREGRQAAIEGYCRQKQIGG